VDSAELAERVLRAGKPVRMLLGDEPRAVAAPRFLVGRGEQDQVALERHARAGDLEQRRELHDADRLHVERAAPVEPAVADLAAERIDRPVPPVGVHDVDVMVEDDRAERSITGHPRAEVGAAGRRLDDLARDPVAVEHLGQEARPRDLVARRVRRVDREIAAQEVDGIDHRGPRGVNVFTASYWSGHGSS
jgi:hypothetical protein